MLWIVIQAGKGPCLSAVYLTEAKSETEALNNFRSTQLFVTSRVHSHAPKASVAVNNFASFF